MHPIYRLVNLAHREFTRLTLAAGIYTRDLIYNAQKPAFIDAPPVDGERLVNFERHHTAATIVKSLLRLLEASSKYTFKAEPNIISKCLWLAALSDAEITKRSRQYE